MDTLHTPAALPALPALHGCPWLARCDQRADAGAVPKGITNWELLNGWKNYISKPYKFEFKNSLGMKSVHRRPSGTKAVGPHPQAH